MGASQFAVNGDLVWCKAAEKGENIFVMRTRHGGWAKVFVAERESGGGNWTRQKLTFRYVYQGNGTPQLATTQSPG